MKRLIISIEGTVAAGKTTLLNKLYERLSLLSIPLKIAHEPIDLWLKPFDLIKEIELNTDLKPISQLYIFTTLADRIKDCMNFEGVIIIERSVGCALAQFCNDITNPLIRHLMLSVAKVDQLIDCYIPIEISEESNRLNLLKRFMEGERDNEFQNMDIAQKLLYNKQLSLNLDNYLRDNINDDKIYRFNFDNYNESFESLIDFIINAFGKL